MTWRFFKFVYIVLVIESIIFVLFYIFGFHGLLQLRTLYTHRELVMKDIESSMQQKQCLQDELALWQENDFAKEQYARERLHMKKKEEVVYFIKNNTNS